MATTKPKPKPPNRPPRNHVPAPPSARATADPRFARLATDPRYALPSRKQTRVALDARFRHMLDDDEFVSKAKMDRYGRRVGAGAGRGRAKGAGELRRFYRLEDEDEDAEDEGEGGESGEDDEVVQQELRRLEGSGGGETGGVRAKERAYDPARDGGFSGSSSSESESEAEDSDADSSSSESESSVSGGEQDDEAQPSALSLPNQEQKEHETIHPSEATHRLALVNLDWDHIRAVDILAVARSFCPDDGKILSVAVYPSEYGRERMEKEERDGPDWGGKKSTTDKENRREDVGKKTERHSSTRKQSSKKPQHRDSGDDSNSDSSRSLTPTFQPQPDAETAEEASLDTTALRRYQLRRLHYYYAVITASSASAALHLYNAMDGREYLSSANFFDLRFVPDDTSFVDDAPRDSCADMPSNYKPAEFVTDALTRSKVKLTWDEEDVGRKEAQKRAFVSGGGKKGDVVDQDMDDLAAYVGSGSSSGSSSSDSENDNKEGAQPTNTKREKQNARDKMRAALGLATSSSKTESALSSMEMKPKRDPATGPMQITFTSALSSRPQQHQQQSGTEGANAGVFTNRPSDVPADETTREKYIRKERERKARRKERARVAREGQSPGDTLQNENTDEDDEAAQGQTNTAAARANGNSNGNDKAANANANANATSSAEKEEADPFADPFFLNPSAANAAARKQAKRAKSQQKAALEAAAADAKAKERKQLELLLSSDSEAVSDSEPGSVAGSGPISAAKGNGDMRNESRNKSESKTKTKTKRGFNMAEIRRAEKAEAKKGKGKGKQKRANRDAADAGAAADDFKLPANVDDRFGAVYSSHEFALDPSNPRFSGTKAMRGLLEEGRKRRERGEDARGNGEGDDVKGKRRLNDGVGELDDLVKRMKTKRVKV